jgi:hypothetical protein
MSIAQPKSMFPISTQTVSLISTQTVSPISTQTVSPISTQICQIVLQFSGTRRRLRRLRAIPGIHAMATNFFGQFCHF